MKTIVTIFLSLCLSVNLFAQKEILKSDTGRNGSITHQRYDVLINPKPMFQAQTFLRSLLQMSDDDHFMLIRTNVDGNKTHELYQQYYKDYKVLYATYAVHAANNIIETVNGFFFKVGNPQVNVEVPEQAALATVLNFVNAKKYGWQDSSAQHLYRGRQKNEGATLYPKSELVVYYDNTFTNSYRLVHQFHIYAVQPFIDCNIYVDAATGKIIYNENLILDNNVTGTGVTIYSGTRTITMDSYSSPTKYRLEESRLGVNNVSTLIRTYNMGNTGVRTDSDFTNATTTWSTDASLDAHWGAEMVLDYWSHVRGRNSYDNQGSALIGYVHANLPLLNPQEFGNNDNAFWDRTLKVMTYGDGTNGGPEVSIDIVGHEIGHGFCQSTANLQGSTGNFEPDALNEGLSDIWGAVVRNYAAPDQSMWLHNDLIHLTGSVRSLNDPHSAQFPDTYKGQFWDNSTTNPDPHKNSTVLSHWFYLLSVGGSGRNNGQTAHATSGGYHWSVTGIGTAKAAAIVWAAESNHFLLTNTDYAGASTAMINAAISLYCANSPEVAAVTNAWNAVGIGDAFSGSVMTIAGSGFLCPSAQYSVSNLTPTGASYTWSSSNPSGISINSSGLAQLVGNYSGSVVISATFGSGCSLSKTIAKGFSPTIDGTYNNGQPMAYTPYPDGGPINYNSVCAQTVTSTDMTITGAASGQWQLISASPSASFVSWWQTDNNLSVDFAGSNESAHFRFTTANTCYSTANDYYFSSTNCGGGGGCYAYTVSPNPSSSKLNIVVPDMPQPCNTATTIITNTAPISTQTENTLTIQSVSLYSSSDGQLMRTQQFPVNTKKVNLDVSGLQRGIYVLRISDGGHRDEAHRVIIE